MKRILLIGNCPLPDENSLIRPAAGLRTYQFLKPLIGKFEVKLVAIAMPECLDRSERERTEVSRLNISKDDPCLIQKIQKAHDEFQPDAIVAVNTHPCSVACRLASRAPIWADLNGWIMAEAQAQAYKTSSNDYLPHYFEMEKAVIARGDKFSAVSEAQKFALLGELAFCGRLCAESFGYTFAHYIANGTEDFEGEGTSEKLPSAASTASSPSRRIDSNTAPTSTPCFLADDSFSEVPPNAFVLFWAGGYNTWVDEVTLFKGVESAMRACGKLYFVSTGGDIPGLDNKTFAKFRAMIEESEFKDRFVFLGWVETAKMPDLYDRADCGINVDRNCVETLTGARNRINEMMKFGLPVITTLGSEISYEAEKAGGGICVRSGDHEGLCGAIAAMYEEWRGGGELSSRKFRDYGKKGRTYVEEFCGYERLLGPLLKWLENPRPAPDRGVRISFSPVRLRMMWRYFKENGFKKSFKKFLQKVRGG